MRMAAKSHKTLIPRETKMVHGATDIEETEANYFAMCLLIPRDCLLEDLRKLGGFDIADDAALKKLSKRYQVSTTVMALRIM